MVATTIGFHKKIKKIIEESVILDSYFDVSMDNGITYFNMLKNISGENNAENIVRYLSNAFNIEYEYSEYLLFLEKISKRISSQLAKDVYEYGSEDRNIEGVIIPFYQEELYNINIKTSRIDEGKLYITTENLFIVYFDIEGIYRKKEYFQIYVCDTVDNSIISYEVKEEEIAVKDKLNLYTIDYEHFSSSCVDVGGSQKVYAVDRNEARWIFNSINEGPDDGLSWDVTVYSPVEGEEPLEDNSSCSYLQAVELPGIAAAEAA